MPLTSRARGEIKICYDISSPVSSSGHKIYSELWHSRFQCYKVKYHRAEKHLRTRIGVVQCRELMKKNVDIHGAAPRVTHVTTATCRLAVIIVACPQETCWQCETCDNELSDKSNGCRTSDRRNGTITWWHHDMKNYWPFMMSTVVSLHKGLLTWCVYVFFIASLN